MGGGWGEGDINFYYTVMRSGLGIGHEARASILGRI